MPQARLVGLRAAVEDAAGDHPQAVDAVAERRQQRGEQRRGRRDRHERDEQPAQQGDQLDSPQSLI